MKIFSFSNNYVYVLLLFIFALQFCSKKDEIKNRRANDSLINKNKPIYFLQRKSFYFQVSINQKIYDTICLKTYPDFIFEQGRVGWIYNLRKEKPDEYFTGVIENDSVVWLHPPRHFIYSILGITAFPTFVKPFKVGKSWKWNLRVADIFISKDWGVEWTGLLDCNFDYSVVDSTSAIFMNEKLRCYRIASNSNSKAGKMKALTLFNPKFGFVNMEYQIFGKELVFKLIDVKEYFESKPTLFRESSH